MTGLLLLASLACGPEIASVERYRDIVSQATPVADIIGRLPAQPSDTAFHVFERDPQGRVIRVTYCANGEAAPSPDINAAQIAVAYKAGIEIRSYWGADGAPATVWRIGYNGLSRNTEGGVHREIYQLDDQDRRIAMTLEAIDGGPVQTPLGQARYAWVWESPNAVVESRFDQDGRLAAMTHFFDFRTVRILFDGLGLHERLDNLVDGVVAPAPASGVAVATLDYDVHSRETGLAFFTAQGQAFVRRQFGDRPYGFASMRYDFDSQGRLTHIRHFGPDGELIDTSAGYAIDRYIYSGAGETQNVQVERIRADGSLLPARASE